MSIRFDLYNQTLIFNDTLKKYYQIKIAFDGDYDYIEEIIDTHDRQGLPEMFDSVNKKLQSIAKTIIQNLSNYGIYNITVEDLLYPNEGYVNAFNNLSSYLDFTKKLLEKKSEITDSELEKAKLRAESQITGPNYGIVTNSIAAQALYGLEASNTIDRQKKRALEQYTRESAKIQSHLDSITDEKLDEIYINEFIPEFKSSLKKCVDLLFNSYMEKLADVDQIESDCSNQMNYERSSSLLNNINVVDNKEKLLFEVAQLCPTNIDLYCIAFDHNLFTDDFLNLVNYFELSRKIIDSIIKSKNICISSPEENVIDFCSNNLKYFEFFSKLEGKTIDSYKTQFTEDVYKNIQEKVKDACNILKDTEIDHDYELFNNLNLPENNSLLEHIETGNEILCLLKKEEFVYLIEDCNHRDFYKDMSSLLNQEIKTIDELQDVVETLIENKTLIYQKWLDEKKRAEELRKKEREQRINNLKKTARKIFIGIIAFFLISTLISGTYNFIKDLVTPYDEEVLNILKSDDIDYYEECLDDLSDSNAHNICDINDKAIDYKHKRIKDNFLKTQFKKYVKGCELQNKAMTEYDNDSDEYYEKWDKGPLYKINALSSLSSKKVLNYTNSEKISIVNKAIATQVATIWDSTDTFDYKKNKKGKWVYTMTLTNETGYNIEDARFTLDVNYDSSKTYTGYWKNGESEKIIFDIDKIIVYYTDEDSEIEGYEPESHVVVDLDSTSN